jgi:chromosome segregation ATPase
MAVSRLAKFGVVIIALTGAAVVTTWAQGLGQSSGGSLSELTAEVRQLRQVIHEAGRNQTQMQAVSISLTAQHSRLAQVSARLDAVQDELTKAAEKTQAALQLVVEAQNEIRTASAVGREHWEGVVKTRKAQADVAAEAENRIRVRQLDLMNSFRADEARWHELVAKLDEILKK